MIITLRNDNVKVTFHYVIMIFTLRDDDIIVIYLRGSDEFGVIELDLSFSIKLCSVSIVSASSVDPSRDSYVPTFLIELRVDCDSLSCDDKCD